MRVCALVDYFLLWIFSTHPQIPILAAMYLHFGMGQLGWQPTAGYEDSGRTLTYGLPLSIQGCNLNNESSSDQSTSNK